MLEEQTARLLLLNRRNNYLSVCKSTAEGDQLSLTRHIRTLMHQNAGKLYGFHAAFTTPKKDLSIKAVNPGWAARIHP